MLDDAYCAELGIDTEIDTVMMPAITDDTPDPDTTRASARTAGAEVVSLHSRVLELQERPLSSLDIYDRLLTRGTKGTSA